MEISIETQQSDIQKSKKDPTWAQLINADKKTATSDPLFFKKLYDSTQTLVATHTIKGDYEKALTVLCITLQFSHAKDGSATTSSSPQSIAHIWGDSLLLLKKIGDEICLELNSQKKGELTSPKISKEIQKLIAFYRSLFMQAPVTLSKQETSVSSSSDNSKQKKKEKKEKEHTLPLGLSKPLSTKKYSEADEFKFLLGDEDSDDEEEKEHSKPYPPKEISGPKQGVKRKLFLSKDDKEKKASSTVIADLDKQKEIYQNVVQFFKQNYLKVDKIELLCNITAAEILLTNSAMRSAKKHLEKLEGKAVNSIYDAIITYAQKKDYTSALRDAEFLIDNYATHLTVKQLQQLREIISVAVQLESLRAIERAAADHESFIFTAEEVFPTISSLSSPTQRFFLSPKPPTISPVTSAVPPASSVAPTTSLPLATLSVKPPGS